jgi:hypothetical protein
MPKPIRKNFSGPMRATRFATDRTNRPVGKGGHYPRSYRGASERDAYIVVWSPTMEGDDLPEYSLGAVFKALEIEFGLRGGAFPDGLKLQKDSKVYTVRCGHLVNSDGGLAHLFHHPQVNKPLPIGD